jgi:hypothetical protein
MAVMSIFGNVQIPQTRIGAKEALGYRGFEKHLSPEIPSPECPAFLRECSTFIHRLFRTLSGRYACLSGFIW